MGQVQIARMKKVSHLLLRGTQFNNAMHMKRYLNTERQLKLTGGSYFILISYYTRAGTYAQLAHVIFILYFRFWFPPSVSAFRFPFPSFPCTRWGVVVLKCISRLEEIVLIPCHCIDKWISINVQKQLDLSRRICLSSIAKRKGTQKIDNWVISLCT